MVLCLSLVLESGIYWQPKTYFSFCTNVVDYISKISQLTFQQQCHISYCPSSSAFVKVHEVHEGVCLSSPEWELVFIEGLSLWAVWAEPVYLNSSSIITAL